MPTGTWKSRLRSGSAGARGGGPAVPTGIWSSRWRPGCARWDLDCEEEAAGEEAEEAMEVEEAEEENSSDKI